MIQPTKGRILIKKLEAKDAQTDSGMIIPGQALQEESLYYGEVMSKGHELYPQGLKVYYSRYSATRVSDPKGNALYIVSDLDVMATDE